MKKTEGESGKAVHKGHVKRLWEGCTMKKTDGESGKAVHKEDGKRG